MFWKQPLALPGSSYDLPLTSPHLHSSIVQAVLHLISHQLFKEPYSHEPTNQPPLYHNLDTF